MHHTAARVREGHTPSSDINPNEPTTACIAPNRPTTAGITPDGPTMAGIAPDGPTTAGIAPNGPTTILTTQCAMTPQEISNEVQAQWCTMQTIAYMQQHFMEIQPMHDLQSPRVLQAKLENQESQPDSTDNE